MGRSRLTDIFGRNLRRLRTAKGLSQEGLAHLVGVHRNYVGALERGERNPTLVSVERVAEALGTDPAEMLRESQSATPDLGPRPDLKTTD